MKQALPYVILPLLLLAGCGAKQSSSAPAPEATASAGSPKAADNTKSFTYAVVSNQKDSKETQDTFTKDAPIVYVNFGWDKEIGSKIKGVWICDKSTNPKVPANTKIDEATLNVVSPMNSGDFSLSKPNAGWPVGDYHCDIYSDDVLVTSVKFKVN